MSKQQHLGGKTQFAPLSAVVAGLVGNAAIAGAPEQRVDHVHVAPPVAQAAWTGFYAGFPGGEQSGEITPGPRSFDITSCRGFAGYTVQKAQVVFGADVAARRGTTKSDKPAFDLDGVVDAKARVGYSTLQPTDMPFSASGRNAGAGVDYALDDKAFIGGECVCRSLPTTGPDNSDYASHGVQLRAGLRV